MASKIKAQPEGYHAITPYLIIKNAAQAIEYYKKVFGATELLRVPFPDGRVGHAELKIGDSIIMLSDEFPEGRRLGPQTLGNTPVGLNLYVEDVDQVFRRAVEAGGKVDKPVQDQFYGDRNGTLLDPFGHLWTIATHKEDVSPEEIQRRLAAMK